jgi:FkbM family methyltransferase
MAYFSQFEEDRLIEEYVKNNNLNITPSLVEIGCAYPEFLSNSKNFIDKGYKAILIDANNKFSDLQSHYHSLNTNVEVVNCAITDFEGEVSFDTTQEFTHGGISNDGQIKVKAQTLKKVLEDSKLNLTEIGILSLDVEGHDQIVLESIFKDNIYPEIIIVEANDKKARDEQEKILSEKYDLIIETAHGLFEKKTFQILDFYYHKLFKKHFLLGVNTIWLRKDKHV